MLNIDQIEIARNNWIKASGELGFKIITPFEILIEKSEKEVFAYLPEYGSLNGAIFELFTSSDFKIDDRIKDWAVSNNCFYSFCSIESFLEYDVVYFREILKDWKIS
ncbi:MAG TPA: hypothetical protein VK772_15145 [Puia sp.]|jgi:hypothetical protein|nr:hypothetical protein [Puia sp.]